MPMLKRWLLYIGALLGCLSFWAANQGWVAWCLLQLTFFLPLFSLLVSLVPILTTRAVFPRPAAVAVGTEVPAQPELRHLFPQTPCRCRVHCENILTGECQLLRPDESFSTAHCGQLRITWGRLWVYDYLGLFALPRTRTHRHSLLIRPAAIPAELPRELNGQLGHSWQPKPGGGFSENYELRLYRPGDGLNQIHWKLSAKTKKLTVREPMIPRCGSLLVTVALWGTPEELDTKLGQLLWLGSQLLERQLCFQLQALTGDGVVSLSVTDGSSLENAMDRLLSCLPLAEAPGSNAKVSAGHFHIGGEPDEA